MLPKWAKTSEPEDEQSVGYMQKHFVKRIQTLDVEKNQVLAIALHNIT